MDCKLMAMGAMEVAFGLGLDDEGDMDLGQEAAPVTSDFEGEEAAPLYRGLGGLVSQKDAEAAAAAVAQAESDVVDAQPGLCAAMCGGYTYTPPASAAKAAVPRSLARLLAKLCVC